MIHRELGDEIHLTRERRVLQSMLAQDEELLDVAAAGLGFGNPGILAITDRRMIHLYFRYFLRHVKMTEIGYHKIETVDSAGWRSFAELSVRRGKRRRTLHISIMAGVERAAELATCARKAVARFKSSAGVTKGD